LHTRRPCPFHSEFDHNFKPRQVNSQQINPQQVNPLHLASETFAQDFVNSEDPFTLTPQFSSEQSQFASHQSSQNIDSQHGLAKPKKKNGQVPTV